MMTPTARVEEIFRVLGREGESDKHRRLSSLITCHIREAVMAVLEKSGRAGHCRGCGAAIWWMRHSNGKSVPYSEDGVNHFIDCSQAQRFRAADKPLAESQQ